VLFGWVPVELVAPNGAGGGCLATGGHGMAVGQPGTRLLCTRRRNGPTARGHWFSD
jgi:hypothetical protein